MDGLLYILLQKYDYIKVVKYLVEQYRLQNMIISKLSNIDLLLQKYLDAETKDNNGLQNMIISKLSNILLNNITQMLK